MSTAKPDIVTPEQRRAAREALLEQEKAHTRGRDALAAERATKSPRNASSNAIR